MRSPRERVPSLKGTRFDLLLCLPALTCGANEWRRFATLRRADFIGAAFTAARVTGSGDPVPHLDSGGLRLPLANRGVGFRQGCWRGRA
jgi:hypothetical protein